MAHSFKENSSGMPDTNRKAFSLKMSDIYIGSHSESCSRMKQD